MRLERVLRLPFKLGRSVGPSAAMSLFTRDGTDQPDRAVQARPAGGSPQICAGPLFGTPADSVAGLDACVRPLLWSKFRRCPWQENVCNFNPRIVNRVPDRCQASPLEMSNSRFYYRPLEREREAGHRAAAGSRCNE